MREGVRRRARGGAWQQRRGKVHVFPSGERRAAPRCGTHPVSGRAGGRRRKAAERAAPGRGACVPGPGGAAAGRQRGGGGQLRPYEPAPARRRGTRPRGCGHPQFCAGGIPGPCAAVSFRRGEKAGDAGRRPGYGAADAFAGRASGQPGPGKYPPAGTKSSNALGAGPGAYGCNARRGFRMALGHPGAGVPRGTAGGGRGTAEIFENVSLLRTCGLEQPVLYRVGRVLGLAAPPHTVEELEQEWKP